MISAALGLQIALDVLLVALVGLAVGSRWAEALSAGDWTPGRGRARERPGTPGRVRRGAGADQRARHCGRRPARRLVARGAWVAALVVGWALLLLLTPVALWIAFPLMFLEMHVLGPRRGVLAVAVTTACAIGGAILGGQQLVGSILGPTFGGLVAIAVVLGFETIVRESQGRQELIDDLVRTRADLAASEREAAVATERERLAREIHDTLAQGFSSIELLLRAADASLEEVVAPGPSPRLSRPDGGTRRAATSPSRGSPRSRTWPRRGASCVTWRPPTSSPRPSWVRSNGLPTARRSPQGRADRHGRGLGPGPPAARAGRDRAAADRAVRARERRPARGASRAAVTLSFLGDAVALDVVDDGRGFDPRQVAAAAGPRAGRTRPVTCAPPSGRRTGNPARQPRPAQALV
ncbi:histidine kinase [Oerskovia sp. M15]